MAWPYLKPSQLGLYVDTRLLPQLVADVPEGQAPPTFAQVTTAGTPEYDRIAEGLKWGATQIDMALRAGNRYDPGALKDLAEPVALDLALPKPEQDYGVVLRQLNFGLMVKFLQQRRLRPSPEFEALGPVVDDAEHQLEQLKLGGELLPEPTKNDAGVKADLAGNRLASGPGLVRAQESDQGVPWLPARGWPQSRDHDRSTFSDRFSEREPSGHDDDLG